MITDVARILKYEKNDAVLSVCLQTRIPVFIKICLNKALSNRYNKTISGREKCAS